MIQTQSKNLTHHKIIIIIEKWIKSEWNVDEKMHVIIKGFLFLRVGRRLRHRKWIKKLNATRLTKVNSLFMYHPHCSTCVCSCVCRISRIGISRRQHYNMVISRAPSSSYKKATACCLQKKILIPFKLYFIYEQLEWCISAAFTLDVCGTIYEII